MGGQLTLELVAVPKPGMSRKTRNILTAVVLAFPCIGLPLIAIPNFINFGARARRAECYNNLKSLYTELKTSDHAAPGSELTFSQFGFSPERANRYSYFLGAGPIEDRSRSQTHRSENAHAVGVDTFRFHDLHVYSLIDNDSTDAPDVWSIASRARDIDGKRVEAGEPYCHMDDASTD